jgi:hypothetical protein
MPYPLNNVETANAYSTGTTLECPRCIRLNFDVSNASIFYQIGLNINVHKADPNEIMELLGGQPSVFIGNIIYGPEVFTIPKSFSLSRSCDSIRVRSGAEGKPARVSISAWRTGELIGP